MTDTLGGDHDGSRTALGKLRQMRPAVLESELRLAAFEGYLLFPDGLPVAKLKLTAKHIRRRGPAQQQAFIPGEPEDTLWKRAPKKDALQLEPPISQGPV